MEANDFTGAQGAENVASLQDLQIRDRADSCVSWTSDNSEVGEQSTASEFRRRGFERAGSMDNLENVEYTVRHEALREIDELREGRRREKNLQDVMEEAEESGRDQGSPVKRKLVNLDEIGVMGFTTHHHHSDDHGPKTETDHGEAEELSAVSNTRLSEDETASGVSQTELEESTAESELQLLPHDLLPRIVAILPVSTRIRLATVSRTMNHTVQEPILWRHINLSPCSSIITDRIVERILHLSDGLESFVLKPPASPPYLTWRMMQAMSSHLSPRKLRTLVLSNCGGILSNSPRHLRPLIGSDGVKCKIPAKLRFENCGAKGSPKKPARKTKLSESTVSVYADWAVCKDVEGVIVPAIPFKGNTELENAKEILGNIAMVERGGGKFYDVASRCANAGAIGVLFVNNEDAIISMSGKDDIKDSVQVPCVMIKKNLQEQLNLMGEAWSVSFKADIPQVPLPNVSADSQLAGSGSGELESYPALARSADSGSDNPPENSPYRRCVGEVLSRVQQRVQGQSTPISTLRNTQREICNSRASRRLVFVEGEGSSESDNGHATEVSTVINHGFPSSIPHWFASGSLSGLQMLSLSECRWVNDGVFFSFINAATGSDNTCRLREVDLSWTAITDASLQLLGSRAAEHLVKLKARGCSSSHGRKTVTDTGVMGLTTCSSLEALKVYDYGHVTDDSVLALAESCPGLQEISVPSCYSLSDRAITGGAAHWKSLRVIDVSGILGITDASLKSLAFYCPIKEIRFSGCKDITDEGIWSLATMCSGLSRVDISCCPLISDDGITKVVSELQDSLVTLEMAQCTIGDEAVKSVFHMCNKLSLLNLDSCERVTDQALEYFRESRVVKSLKDVWMRGCSITKEAVVKFLELDSVLSEVQVSPDMCSEKDVLLTEWGRFDAVYGSNVLHLHCRKQPSLPNQYKSDQFSGNVGEPGDRLSDA